MAYSSANVFEYRDSFTFRCYVCGRLLGDSPLSRDHIIPQALFGDEKTLRPTINVHSSCNSVDKSRDDRWFSKVVMYRCMESQKAQNRLLDFINSAEKSRTKSGDTTAKDTSNHKLLKTMLDGWYELPKKPASKKYAATMRPTREAWEREENYIKMMARGLIIRNSWFARVTIGDVQTFPFNILRNEHRFSDFIRDSKQLFYPDLNACIYQFWDDDIKYIINPQLGIVYFEFFDQVGYAVQFEIFFPQLEAKEYLSKENIDEAQQYLTDRIGFWSHNTNQPS